MSAGQDSPAIGQTADNEEIPRVDHLARGRPSAHSGTPDVFDLDHKRFGASPHVEANRPEPAPETACDEPANDQAKLCAEAVREWHLEPVDERSHARGLGGREPLLPARADPILASPRELCRPPATELITEHFSP